MRTFVTPVAACFVALVTLALNGAEPASERPPNIVFIMADDN